MRDLKSSMELDIILLILGACGSGRGGIVLSKGALDVTCA
jgi:hypothetical protein